MRWLLLLAFLAAAVPARADEILAWDKVTQALCRSEHLPRERADETLSMVRAAVDDAVNKAAPMGGGASADVAAAMAAHDVLVKLFPSRRAQLDRRLDALKVDLDQESLEAAAIEGKRAAEAVLTSEWSWRHPVRRRVRVDAGPKVQDMTLPMHRSSLEPLAPPARDPAKKL